MAGVGAAQWTVVSRSAPAKRAGQAERTVSADAASAEDIERLRRMRECLRALRAYHANSIVEPLGDVLVHGLVYVLAVALVLTWPGPVIGCIGIAIACYKAGRLFEVGHDACHGSYTPNANFNRWIGRLAFLPSLHVFSLWRFGHNVLHHGYSNLRGKDFVCVEPWTSPGRSMETGAVLRLAPGAQRALWFEIRSSPPI